MFEGKGVIFSGGISAARIRIFAKIWEDHGGIVHIRKKGIGKHAITPLSSEINYIIIENKNITYHNLCKLLCCDNIPETIEIIHCQWLERCAQYKNLQNIEDYQINLCEERKLGEEEKKEDRERVLIEEVCEKRNVGFIDENEQPLKKKLRQCDDERVELSRDVSPGVPSYSNFHSEIENGPKRYAGIIMRHGRSIFLVQPTGSAGYGLPKGAVSPHESLRDGAIREFKEETGIDIPSTAILEYIEESGRIHGQGQKTVHAFLYEGSGNERYLGSNVIEHGFRKGQQENCNGRYFEIEEALEVIHKNQRKLLELYANNYL